MKKKLLQTLYRKASAIALMGIGLGASLGAAAANVQAGSEVSGYQSASFGSSSDVVEQAIHKDFPSARIESRDDESTGTTIKSVSVDQLAPFNAPAQVNYRFGYKSKALIQVDVIWSVEKTLSRNAPDFEKALGNLITTYTGQPWRKDGVIQSYFIGTAKADQPYQFLFFRGMSEQGRMIALLGDPVYAKASTQGKPLNADVSKVKTIIASYQLNATKPDLKTP